jgi:hypothetical protein
VIGRWLKSLNIKINPWTKLCSLVGRILVVKKK